MLVGDPAPGRFAVPVRVVRFPAAQPTTLPARARSVSLVATDANWLRACVNTPLATVATRQVVVTVIAWTPPWPGWTGRLGKLPGLLRHRVRRSSRRRGRLVVEVVLARPVQLSAVIGAVLDVLSPHAPMPTPISADVAAYGEIPGWLPPSENTAGFAGPDPDDEKIRPYDVLLARPGADAPRAFGGVAIASPDPSGITTPAPTILVDASTCNPRGYRPPAGSDPDGTLHVTGGEWTISTADGTVCAGSLDTLHWDGSQLASLRTLRSVACIDLGGGGAPEAALLARLAMTGVVLTTGRLPTPQLLAPELLAIIAEDPPTGPMEWEIRSVRQRREAMRRHATGLILPPAVGMPYALPTVSALLVVTGVDRAAGAIATVSAQTYTELEIVLGLHGIGRSDVVAAVGRTTRPLRVVEIPAGRTPAEALGEVTARARGSLLARFDEDDNYGCEHLWDLVLARHYSGATVVGKASEFVFLKQLGVTVRRTGLTSETYATRVAGGTLLMSRGDLDAAGGWRPLNPPVGHGLLDRVKHNGGLTYRTHAIGFVHTRRATGVEVLPRHLGQQWTGLPPYDEFDPLADQRR